MNRTEIKQASDMFTSVALERGGWTEEFINNLLRSHRTEQQQVIALCAKVLLAFASADHDLRNQAGVELARRMTKGMDKYDAHLPYI
jgi:hypothetical protein